MFIRVKAVTKNDFLNVWDASICFFSDPYSSQVDSVVMCREKTKTACQADLEAQMSEYLTTGEIKAALSPEESELVAHVKCMVIGHNAVLIATKDYINVKREGDLQATVFVGPDKLQKAVKFIRGY